MIGTYVELPRYDLTNQTVEKMFNAPTYDIPLGKEVMSQATNLQDKAISFLTTEWIKQNRTLLTFSAVGLGIYLLMRR